MQQVCTVIDQLLAWEAVDAVQADLPVLYMSSSPPTHAAVIQPDVPSSGAAGRKKKGNRRG